MSVKVNKMIGHMPPVWQKDVIFIANILALFYGNEVETQVLQKEVGTLETYGSRLLPILNLMFKGSSNLLVLEREPDSKLIQYFQNGLGLELPEVAVLSHKNYTAISNNDKESEEIKSILQKLRNHASQWIDGYVTDDTIMRIAELTDKKPICTKDGSRWGNNKFLLYQFIQSQGLPTFDTCIAESAQDINKAFKGLAAKGYEIAVIKAQVGASGIGMHIVDLKKGLDKIPDYIFYEGPCLVQGWLDGNFPDVNYIGSPSVQMFLNDDSVNLYDYTEQFLSQDSVHEGNIAPPRYLVNDSDTTEEILRQAGVAGEWLHQQGYRGTASSDFHLIERNGSCEVRLCEINARVTGATYPSLLSRHFLPQGAWLMRNIRFDPPVKDDFLLKSLDDHKLLFHPGQREGVLPFNFNFAQAGDIVKGQFLFIGDHTDRVCELLEDVGNIQSLNGSFDRD